MIKRFFKSIPLKGMRGMNVSTTTKGSNSGPNSSNSINKNGNNNSISTIPSSSSSMSSFSMLTNKRVLIDSTAKLNPLYLAKQNPVMFTVEVGFFCGAGNRDISEYICRVCISKSDFLH